MLDDYVEAMKYTQGDRVKVAGGHIWQDSLNSYGPALLYAEIASINQRLKQIFWDEIDDRFVDTANLARAEDLLVDLGNYASFLFDWVQVELKREGEQIIEATLTTAPDEEGITYQMIERNKSE